MRSRLVALAAVALVLGGALIANAAAPSLDATVRTWTFNAVGANGGLVYGTANCPAGQRVTGGGVDSTGTASTAKSFQVVLSGPLDAGGTTAGTNSGDIGVRWYSSIQNFTPTSQDVKGFALCSVYNDAVVQAETADIATSGTIAKTVMCPSGMRAIGGGVNTSTGGNPAPHASVSDWRILVSGPVDDSKLMPSTQTGDIARGWHSSIENNTGSVQTAKFFAMCSKNSDAIVQSIDVVVNNNGAGRSAECPAGRHVTGGGLITSSGSQGTVGVPFTMQVSGPVDNSSTTSGTNDGDVGIKWYAAAGSTIQTTVRVAALCEGDNTPSGPDPTPGPSATPGPSVTPGGTPTATPTVKPLPTETPEPQLTLNVTPRVVRVDTERLLRFSVRAGGPVEDARVRFKGYHGGQIRTSSAGRARLRYSFKHVSALIMKATKEGYKTGTRKFRVIAPE
jgi:hypothetical protein